MGLVRGAGWVPQLLHATTVTPFLRCRRSLRVPTPPSLPPPCAAVAPTACCPLPPSAHQRRCQNPDSIQRLPGEEGAGEAAGAGAWLPRSPAGRRHAAEHAGAHRAQATVRAHCIGAGAAAHLPHIHHAPFWPRRSLQERCATDDTRSEHGVAAYSRRLSTSIESSSYGYDRSPKIVEVDIGRPKSRSSSSRRARSPLLDAGCASGGEEWCANSMSSLLPCYLPGGAAAPPPRIAVPTSRHFPDYDWCTLEKARPATVQSTPRYAHAPPKQRP
ncbi:uncharacterized protein [Oryza sativa Japonica Group]|uniref:uncharacterized protein isoform X2 n=1 Tax=Oryza sativa subsp. japonica TaxID=39947 RepID=UPI000E1BD013|nr:uncharacterized protein LOC9271173 isoform X2 [Oryza sativa Japonica Group]